MIDIQSINLFGLRIAHSLALEMATQLVVIGLAVHQFAIHQFVVRRAVKDDEWERLERTNASASNKDNGYHSLDVILPPWKQTRHSSELAQCAQETPLCVGWYVSQ